MKKWIAGAVVAAGLVSFGSAAIAQDTTPQDARQAQNAQQEEARPDGHEGCRFGQGTSSGDEI